jgi:hypothetical protein
MRTERAILKRVDFWKNDPMLVSGVYRLFVYLKWESIPHEYRAFFEEGAEEKWDDGENNPDTIMMDVKAMTYALVKILAKKNVTQGLGMVPMILADVYVLGNSTDKYQGELSKVLKNYKEYVDYGRDLSEEYAIRGILDILYEITHDLKIKHDFDFNQAVENILEQFKKKQVEITPEIDQDVDKALEEYNSRKDTEDVPKTDI